MPQAAAESASATLRRSTRPSKKRKVDPDNASFTKLVKREPKPEPTVVKEGPQPKRRGKGKLGCLMDMPLDVLFEIFKFTLPSDIMHLTWTTKNFRRVLMHKSSISVWKSAFDNVEGLPKCPSHLNHPQYANLVFGSLCSACGGTARNVDWGLLTRLCIACSREYLGEVTVREESENKLTEEMSYQLVLHRPGRYSRPTYLLAEYEAIELEYYSIRRGPNRDAFAAERKKIVSQQIQFTISCRVWTDAERRRHAQDVRNIRKARKQFIIKKLSGLGWGSEVTTIAPPDYFQDHKLVRIPKPLTERAWKTIELPMIEYMEEMKKHRLARELAAKAVSRKCFALAVFEKYMATIPLPYDDVFPGPPDFCDFPAVKSILESPVAVPIDESSFSGIASDIPDMVEIWRTGIKDKLLQLSVNKNRHWLWLRNGDFMSSMLGFENYPIRITEENASEGTLKLATTVFQCGTCYSLNLDGKSADPLFYPEVLGHVCLTRPLKSYPFQNPMTTDISRQLDNYPGWRRKWTCDGLTVDSWTAEIVHQLVELAGLDPEKATPNDLDVSNDRFYCTVCPKSHGRVQACSWRSAIEHMATNHPKADVKWEILNRHSTREAYASERLLVKLFQKRYGEHHNEEKTPLQVKSQWMCVRCYGKPCELPACGMARLETHLETEHEIEEPVENVDYFREFGRRSEKYDVKAMLAQMCVQTLPWYQREEWQVVVGLLKELKRRSIASGDDFDFDFESWDPWESEEDSESGEDD